MGLRNYNTSNPVFTGYFWDGNNRGKSKMTVLGIFIKSFVCILIIAGITACIWKLNEGGMRVRWFTLGGMLGAVVTSVIISVRKQWAWFLVPIYTIAKGCFLGGFSAYAHRNYPELPYQAIGVTIVTFFVMLLLYQLRIIVVSKFVRSIIVSAAATIFVVYIISWILSFFGIKSYIWGTSNFAIAFNVIAAIVASFALLLDFDYIERYKGRASKDKEWLATWGLLATLIWLYVEILRFMQKLAIRF